MNEKEIDTFLLGAESQYLISYEQLSMKKTLATSRTSQEQKNKIITTQNHQALQRTRYIR